VITEQDIESRFSYHAPDDDQKVKFASIRGAAKMTAKIIIKNTPECADQTAAIRLLREAVMTANVAIACGS